MGHVGRASCRRGLGCAEEMVGHSVVARITVPVNEAWVLESKLVPMTEAQKLEWIEE